MLCDNAIAQHADIKRPEVDHIARLQKEFGRGRPVRHQCTGSGTGTAIEFSRCRLSSGDERLRDSYSRFPALVNKTQCFWRLRDRNEVFGSLAIPNARDIIPVINRLVAIFPHVIVTRVDTVANRTTLRQSSRHRSALRPARHAPPYELPNTGHSTIRTRLPSASLICLKKAVILKSAVNKEPPGGNWPGASPSPPSCLL